MSIVTSVTIITHCAENTIVPAINGWLLTHGCSPLIQIDSHSGGNKAMQCNVWAGAYSRMIDDLPKVFAALSSDYPENLVMIIQPEEGPTEVHYQGVP